MTKSTLGGGGFMLFYDGDVFDTDAAFSVEDDDDDQEIDEWSASVKTSGTNISTTGFLLLVFFIFILCTYQQK